uniref:Uncharacterized protein n=1 Tax=Cannabis sativa TaxID=3483 RepID=A0A803QLA8_CANSA
MKREGRQHGMVRTCQILSSPSNPRPETKFVNRFDTPTTAGLFTRVSSKPTNHSKFTGKCGQSWCNGCHLHPAHKAKDKIKGTQKLKLKGVVSNNKDSFSGFSATSILDHIYNMDDNEEEGVDHA